MGKVDVADAYRPNNVMFISKHGCYRTPDSAEGTRVQIQLLPYQSFDSLTNGLLIYILIRLFDNLCSLVYFSNEVVQTRLTLQMQPTSMQPTGQIATYFDLVKWRNLADSLENTLHIMRERTGLWFPVFYQLTVDLWYTLALIIL